MIVARTKDELDIAIRLLSTCEEFEWTSNYRNGSAPWDPAIDAPSRFHIFTKSTKLKIDPNSNLKIFSLTFNSVSELLSKDTFITMCEQLKFTFNEVHYNRVIDFIGDGNPTPQFVIRKLTYDDTDMVEDFCYKCKRKLYRNNSSLDAMKWNWCMDNGQWIGVIEDGQLIAVCGMHPYKDGWRLNFRAAELKPRKTFGLNRYMMACWAIYLIPYQLDILGGTEIAYITTNAEQDRSGKMNRVHNAHFSLEKAGMMHLVDIVELYDVKQGLWKIDMPGYWKKRI